MDRLVARWKHLARPHYRAALARYRAVARRKETWRVYSGNEPSNARAWGRTVRLRFAPRKTVLFYPDGPFYWSVVYKLCVLSGYRVTTDPGERCHAVFHWEYATRSTSAPPVHGEAAINRRCKDISKERVSERFADVFGYDLGVDPTVYAGAVVKKSDENATHDGEVIECPIPPESVVEGYVYQKAVDNRRAAGAGFYEYRVPIFDRALPTVYVKYRPADARFTEFDGAEVVAPDAVLSRAEQGQILELAQALHMEYGEMDVLRDRGDSRIYVVDANNTPSGPERGFDPAERVAALRALRPAFEALVARSGRQLAVSVARGPDLARGAPTGPTPQRGLEPDGVEVPTLS